MRTLFFATALSLSSISSVSFATHQNQNLPLTCEQTRVITLLTTAYRTSQSFKQLLPSTKEEDSSSDESPESPLPTQVTPTQTTISDWVEVEKNDDWIEVLCENEN